jgi:hypothetical protein
MENIKYFDGPCTFCGAPVVPGYAVCADCLNRIRNPEFPGITPCEGLEVRYVLDDGNDTFIRGDGLFSKLTGMELSRSPKNGGIMAENCKLFLPTNELFHAVSYRLDVEGWRFQIEESAKMTGLLTLRIDGEQVVISDKRSYLISECRFEWYDDEYMKMIRKGRRKKPKA